MTGNFLKELIRIWLLVEKINGTQVVKIQVDKGEMECEIKFNMPLKIIKFIFSYFHIT